MRMGIVNIYELMSSQNGHLSRVRHPAGVQTLATLQTLGVPKKDKPHSGRTFTGMGEYKKDRDAA